MARSAALKESDWFELADDVASAGQTPSTKLLASVAQERYGITASFTTIQRALDSWRRLGGEDRPRELNPEFMQIVIKGFAPIYQELLALSRAQFEPRVEEFQARAEEARARLMTVRTEAEQLHNERTHLREELRSVLEREREHTAALASSLTKVDELQALIETLSTNHRQQLAELQWRMTQQEDRHAREREQLIEQQRTAVSQAIAGFDIERADLLTRARAEAERRNTEFTGLREMYQELQAACAAIGAQKDALEGQLATAGVAAFEQAERIEKLREELKSAQARGQRTEQALRDARAANTQMETAYQERINALQEHLESLSKGQAAIQQQFMQLVEQMAQRRRSDPSPGNT